MGKKKKHHSWHRRIRGGDRALCPTSNFSDVIIRAKFRRASFVFSFACQNILLGALTFHFLLPRYWNKRTDKKSAQFPLPPAEVFRAFVIRAKRAKIVCAPQGLKNEKTSHTLMIQGKLWTLWPQNDWNDCVHHIFHVWTFMRTWTSKVVKFPSVNSTEIHWDQW